MEAGECGDFERLRCGDEDFPHPNRRLFNSNLRNSLKFEHGSLCSMGHGSCPAKFYETYTPGILQSAFEILLARADVCTRHYFVYAWPCVLDFCLTLDSSCGNVVPTTTPRYRVQLHKASNHTQTTLSE